MSERLQAASVISELEKAGKANTAKIYARHGVTSACFGVTFADLKAWQKRLRGRSDLVVPLWKTAVLEPRLLALRLAKASDYSAAELDLWLEDVDSPMLTDGFASFVSEHPEAPKLAAGWITRDHERQEATGWTLATLLVMTDRLELDVMRAYTQQITQEIHGAKNRVKHSMNNCLIAIGGHVAGLEGEAKAAAVKIGKVEVDHGQTDCKTPEAGAYIDKMIAHRQAKAARASRK